MECKGLRQGRIPQSNSKGECRIGVHDNEYEEWRAVCNRLIHGREGGSDEGTLGETAMTAFESECEGGFSTSTLARPSSL